MPTFNTVLLLLLIGLLGWNGRRVVADVELLKTDLSQEKTNQAVIMTQLIAITDRLKAIEDSLKRD